MYLKLLFLMFGLILISSSVLIAQEQSTVTKTGSTETHCKIIDGEKSCFTVLYSGVRFAQDTNGNWVDPSEVLRITKYQDDLTFSYDGIKGDYSVTFEVGVIYNGNYYSMAEVKQLVPEIEFDFPIKIYPATKKYAVNITNIPLVMQPNINNITLTYKNHSGFTLEQLKSEKGKYLIKDIFELVFDDLKENHFIVKINKNEKRIYIGNLSDKFVDNSLYLDPTIKLQEANTQNLDDTEVGDGDPDGTMGGAASTISQKFGSNTLRIYIKFNISSIPSGQQIDESTFWMYMHANVNNAQYATSAYHVYYYNWTEETTTWNNQVCGVSETTLNSDCNNVAEDSYTPPSTDSGIWFNWTVTTAVSQEYNNGDLNVSFLIESLGNEGTWGYYQYYSKEETSDTTLRPYLNITYSEAPAGDTCSPTSPLTADHTFTASDNCVITSNIEAGNNNIVCSGGTGTLTLDAVISNPKNVFIHKNCNLICRKTPSCFS